MQVAPSTPVAGPQTHSLSGPAFGVDALGSISVEASPSTPSRRRLRRSLRLSGASLSSPQQGLNKENLGASPLSQPSTSAKTLDVGLSDNGTLSSPRLSSSPLTSSSPINTSPLRSRSPRKQNSSPLRRTFHAKDDDGNVSSSDESDDSTLVFFGKPSSAEKKKRVHYEQRVLEKRLKHKDSLDLARRRPISFNPDDTMLIEDFHAPGWSWSRPTPTPTRSSKLVLVSAASSPLRSESPTKSIGTPLSSSPEPLRVSLQQREDSEEQASTCLAPQDTSDPSPRSELPIEAEASQSTETAVEADSTQEIAEASPSTEEAVGAAATQDKSADAAQHDAGRAEDEVNRLKNVNPFVEAQKSPEKESTVQTSPSKQRAESPQRMQSPVRSVEMLIGATMAHNKDLASPSRSPRRSPRLSLRSLQLSASSTKIGSAGLFFGSSTPFQQPPVQQQAIPLEQSTPFQKAATAPPIPPSTGLSRFACLQNLSPINSRVMATPGSRALSLRLASHVALPSPFIAGRAFESTFAVLASAPNNSSPSRSPSRTLRLASPGKHVAYPPPNDQGDVKQISVPGSEGASNAAAVPGTPIVRFALPGHIETPSKTEGPGNKDLFEARLPSPRKDETVSEVQASPERAHPLVHAFTSPMRQDRNQATHSLSTPPPAASAEAKPETPGLVFRQTARRVPIQQHEADFGVKVSPEKPSYSPRRAYANSSARNNDYGMKAERVPARRVLVQPPPAARQASGKLTESQAIGGAARVASVASKAARTVSNGATRIGGQSSSLPATALSRFASSGHVPASATSTSATAAGQPAARSVSSSQGSSVASKASRLQRPASVAFGTKPNSPSKQARSLSGLPRPRSMQAPSSSAPASGPGSRLPRPATVGPSGSVAKLTSRPVPMAVARLAPSQQALNRTPAVTAATRAQTNVTPINTSSGESSPSSVASDSASDSPAEVKQTPEGSVQSVAAIRDGETVATRLPVNQARQPIGTLVNSGLRRQASTSALRDTVRDAQTQSKPGSTAEAMQNKTNKAIGATGDDVSARSSSLVIPVSATKPASPVRAAPPALDAEQQRLRCLAMQEKARNRTPKGSSSSGAPTSSDVEEPPSSDAGPVKGSSPTNVVEHTVSTLPGATSAPTAVEALAAKHAEAVDATSSVQASSSGAILATASAGPAAASAGRPLRSARTASRTLTPSATRVPPARGRALSLNDIIAARKIDVPLSLTDQLKLADTVNKKHNEKTLARYKITKIQRPYERPPSPDRHDHEPEACTIIEDLSTHRQGKGDIAPYSTPPKSSTSTFSSSGKERKTVRWYRPLFVGQGAQYGIKACESRPALKPIQYELDKLGNKVATGCSPKLLKGHSIVIYRNYFKGEPEPADD